MTPDFLDRQLERHWLRWTLIAWCAFAGWFLWQRWGNIYWLSLSDTDDNMRLMQVRGLLSGQGWYDLRQYRLNPPGGFDIHWSRIVDLPIAGLILFFRLFTGPAWAERMAVAIAPLIPFSVAMVSTVIATRRLMGLRAWPVALMFLFSASTLVTMFMPLRIDHHGWQLAALAVTVAALADPRRARGGAIVGVASAFSLTIGLEMLPYCAGAGGILALRWVWDRAEGARIAAYGAALAGGSAAGFVLFASNANYAMRCDALTPVWLSATVAGGALLLALAWLNPSNRGTRLILAVVAGAALAGAFATLFPHCLSRPEGVSDELARTWLANVREARPIYRHKLSTGIPMATLPLIGLIGALVATWRARQDAVRLAGWVPVTLFTALATALLLWQVRVGPAAQLLAVPGATALACLIIPWILRRTSLPIRVLGVAAVFVLGSGLGSTFVTRWFPVDRSNAFQRTVSRANQRCGTIPAMRPLNRLPAQTVFTHVDLGPRLIALTHHNAIAGPYHRNGDAILDVHHAFQGSAENFHRIARAHGATLLLVCPNMAETTNYRARAPGGFYTQIVQGRVPAFLEPVELPRGSPFRLWRIK